MRRLCDMTGEDRATYLNMLAQATEAVVPPDVTFVIVLLDEAKRDAHYVGNGSLDEMARMTAEASVIIGRDSRSGGNANPPSAN